MVVAPGSRRLSVQQGREAAPARRVPSDGMVSRRAEGRTYISRVVIMLCIPHEAEGVGCGVCITWPLLLFPQLDTDEQEEDEPSDAEFQVR